eukprot:GEMP01036665.1.p1 GENE.GEMP01036665.1~~GEMP01036665.1.p1  ORF type:complete len:440 (+),score=82.28 GEMP01036665.1:97-1416(+)
MGAELSGQHRKCRDATYLCVARVSFVANAEQVFVCVSSDSKEVHKFRPDEQAAFIMRPQDENIKIQAFFQTTTSYDMISNHDIPYNLLDPQTGGFPRSLWLPYEVTEPGTLFRNEAGALHWLNTSADLAEKVKSNYQPAEAGYVFELQTYRDVPEGTSADAFESQMSNIAPQPEPNLAYDDETEDIPLQGPTYSEQAMNSRSVYSTPPEPACLAPQPRLPRYLDGANDWAAELDGDVINCSHDDLVVYCQKLQDAGTNDSQTLAHRETEINQLMASNVELQQKLRHFMELPTKPSPVARPVSVPVVKSSQVANLEAICRLYEQEAMRLADTVKQKESDLQAINQKTQQEQQNFAQKLADKEQEMLLLEQTFSDYRRETESLRRPSSDLEKSMRAELETLKNLLQQMEKSQDDVAHRSMVHYSKYTILSSARLLRGGGLA